MERVGEACRRISVEVRRQQTIENSRIHDINRVAYATVAIYGIVDKFVKASF
jgi:hypothetical protein